ncbi:rRNA biogenesis protein RRP5-like [Juglans microcarpa x Juglans regia]|uniref:rRNA biogenesis protein RRP5-like n=1 Tax=Juglans microcarpa x Juglans regia TaxID=2249226 RepID=UPI001B7E84DE|nr:rRNA biogenesis protein RRP5-like [Juglans microcarpa x Juglans regia]
MEDKLMAKDVDFSTGQCVTGYVYKVDSEWVWLTVSRDVRAQLFILDSAHDPSELEGFQKCFHVGKGVSGHILSINNEKRLIRLVLSPSFAVSYGNVGGKDDLKTNHLNDVTSHVHEGDVVGGRISKILAGIGGLLVQIGPQLYGRVHFMELRDSWVPDPF